MLGFEGAAESLDVSVPAIAIASSELFTSTYISLMAGIFSNKKALFCSMHSFSSKDDSSFKAASLPSVSAIPS